MINAPFFSGSCDVEYEALLISCSFFIDRQGDGLSPVPAELKGRVSARDVFICLFVSQSCMLNLQRAHD